MGTPEFRRLVGEIIKFRRSGWTSLSKDVIRLLARAALDEGKITKEEYDKLLKMLGNDREPPPPDYNRSNNNHPD